MFLNRRIHSEILPNQICNAAASGETQSRNIDIIFLIKPSHSNLFRSIGLMLLFITTHRPLYAGFKDVVPQKKDQMFLCLNSKLCLFNLYFNMKIHTKQADPPVKFMQTPCRLLCQFHLYVRWNDHFSFFYHFHADFVFLSWLGELWLQSVTGRSDEVPL